MIYLDNAATTLIKPVTVAQAMLNAMRSCASPGRGGHRAAMRASELVYRCREQAAELAVKDADPMEYNEYKIQEVKALVRRSLAAQI